MAFEKELPQWKEKGVKPPQSKLDEGWKVQDKPPAAWLNWQMNKTYEALKEVQEKAAEKENVQAAKITRDDGTAQLAPDRDINKWNKLGVYSFNEAHVSTPSGFIRGLIFVYEDEVGFTYQMAWEKDGRLAVRTKNEVGKWTEWGGMGTSDELEKILAGYMPKTGGDFDGSVGFPGYGSIMRFTHGTGDNATYEVYNNALRVHWGLAMKTYDESVTGLWDSRTGRWITKGGFSVQRGSGNEKWNVDLSGSQTMDGSLNVKGGATIQGDGPVLTLKGTTHQYINFFAKQSGNRSGYIGASDPNNPGNVAIVSDGGFLVLKGTQGVMVNDRNILIELDQLKQSGVDAKNRIAGALNAKGVTASANEDFATLATKIGQIRTEIKSAVGEGNYGTEVVEIDNLDFVPSIVVVEFGGGFNYRDGNYGYSDKSIYISGSGYFVRDQSGRGAISGRVSTGRDGTTSTEIYVDISWKSNGFKLTTNFYGGYDDYYNAYKNIKNWRAFGV